MAYMGDMVRPICRDGATLDYVAAAKAYGSRCDAIGSIPRGGVLVFLAVMLVLAVAPCGQPGG